MLRDDDEYDDWNVRVSGVPPELWFLWLAGRPYVAAQLTATVHWEHFSRWTCILSFRTFSTRNVPNALSNEIPGRGTQAFATLPASCSPYSTHD